MKTHATAALRQRARKLKTEIGHYKFLLRDANDKGHDNAFDSFSAQVRTLEAEHTALVADIAAIERSATH